jgi:hypothetical protein
MPVAVPVARAPSITRANQGAYGDAGAERQHSGHRQVCSRITWIGGYRGSVDDRRVVLRHINHLRVDRLDYDRLALCYYLLLLIRLQRTRGLRLRAHNLHGLQHPLRIAVIGLAQSRGP